MLGSRGPRKMTAVIPAVQKASDRRACPAAATDGRVASQSDGARAQFRAQANEASTLLAAHRSGRQARLSRRGSAQRALRATQTTTR